MEEYPDKPETISIEQIPDLLNEAYLAYLAWNVDDRVLDLYWDNCLVRNADGTEIKDRVTLLRCRDVRGIAAGTEPSDCFARPSEIRPPGEVTAEFLAKEISGDVRWSWDDESWIVINIRRVEQEVFHSLKSALLFGNEKDIMESPVRVIFNIPGELTEAGDEYDVSILAGCESLTACNRRGEPKSLEIWSAQCAAWWTGWKKHWKDNVSGDQEGCESTVEDSMIPAMRNEADPYYEPPQEPAFALSAHDMPEELLIPLRNWFEGKLEKDCLKIARAWPWGDDLEERARNISGWEPDTHWGYIRAVDEWWQEGDRASVTIRGIMHNAPFSGHPAENMETLWKFAIRRLLGDWTIKSFHYRCPPYDRSISISDDRKPWLNDWRSGPVITDKRKALSKMKNWLKLKTWRLSKWSTDAKAGKHRK